MTTDAANGVSLETMGQRIRYARNWNHWDAKDLREALDRVGITISRQQLSNYENLSSSNPSLAILETIGQVTGFNPGWIAFGLGPVFTIDPVIQLIRAANARSLFKGKVRERKQRTALKSHGADPVIVDECLAKPLLASINDTTARAIEKACEKPTGWLDSPPTDKRHQSKRDQHILVEAIHFAGSAIRLPEHQRHAIQTLIAAFEHRAS